MVELRRTLPSPQVTVGSLVPGEWFYYNPYGTQVLANVVSDGVHCTTVKCVKDDGNLSLPYNLASDTLVERVTVTGIAFKPTW